MASQGQLRQELMMKARQRQIERMARQQQAATSASHQNTMSRRNETIQPHGIAMGSQYNDIPILEAEDFDHISPGPSSYTTFDSACQNGPVSTIEEIATAQTRTPAFLHRGLLIALQTGNVETARFLLEYGTPIARQTPEVILTAPVNQQITLFELFTAHGWTPKNPGYYGAVLLPRVIGNLPLLSWFLAHGANPNLGLQKDFHDRRGSSDTESCIALESAAAHGSVEAVQMLLDGGARIQNGTPLHFAAGVCPPGANPHVGRVKPSKDFDAARIPVMRLLVENGADVNYKVESRHMSPQYAIVHAVMAGAMERVKWLIKQGADPSLEGNFGSAASYASAWDEEMEKSIVEGLAARNGLGVESPHT